MQCQPHRSIKQDWAGAEAAAATVEGMGYSLAPNFSDLFEATGSNSPEDIFRITFLSTQSQSVGFYYLPKALGGRKDDGARLSEACPVFLVRPYRERVSR